jgi:hypothetical protein
MNELFMIGKIRLLAMPWNDMFFMPSGEKISNKRKKKISNFTYVPY